MSSDEEDYMSDKFLQSAEQNADQHHSLLSNNADKRALEILKRKREAEEKQQQQKKKSIRVIEQEKREEGLSSAISSDNKGFAMLAKMGYKPGQGIGKSQTGISEPISINIRENKSGLGKDTKLKEYRAKMKKQMDKFNPTDFRSRLANQKAEQQTKNDFIKSQKICERLDSESNVESPEESWFWPKCETEQTEEEGEEKEEEEEDEEEEEEEEEEDTLTTNEKLEMITEYLRRKYCYCIWCAVKYENEDDLKDNCPGNTRNDH